MELIEVIKKNGEVRVGLNQMKFRKRIFMILFGQLALPPVPAINRCGVL